MSAVLARRTFHKSQPLGTPQPAPQGRKAKKPKRATKAQLLSLVEFFDARRR
jgi:hypothetical protein